MMAMQLRELAVPAPHPTNAPSDLWAHVYGPGTGYIGLFSGRRHPGVKELLEVESAYFTWPEQSDDAEAWLRKHAEPGREVYAAGHLLTGRQRVKLNAARMWALYSDDDGAQVPPSLPRPTAVVQSSPGRTQSYWRLTEAIDPRRAEQLNKRIAYAMGADPSGWDLTQLLRPPGTRNWKYTGGPEVRVLSIEDRAYDPDELDRILPPLPVEAARPTVRLAEGTTTARDDDQARIDKMLNGKRGAELRDLLNGGSKHRKPDGSPDVSADDQSVMNAFAFWLDKDPSRMASAFLASGRNRPKLHERHAADGSTYLEMTIGTAIAGCSQSYDDLVTRAPRLALDGEWFSLESATPPPDADDVTTLRAQLAAAQAEIARRGGVIDGLAEVIQVQQTVIQAERDRLEVIEPIITAIDDILARPDEELNSDDKVVDIGLARWLPFHRAKREANGELPTVALGYLAKVIGMPSRRLSKSLDRQSSDDPDAGAPFRKRVTRKFLEDEQRWESSLEVQPWGDGPAATLRAAATYATPARPKRGGSQAASDARWGRCDKHDNRAVLIKGHCPDCGKVVGERTVTLAEFDALNVQLGYSEETPSAVGVSVLIDVQNGHSDGGRSRQEHLNLQPVHSALLVEVDELSARRAAAAVGTPSRAPDPWKQPAPPEPEPVNLGPINVRPKPSPCPECETLEPHYPITGGEARCPDCGHISLESAEVAG